MQLEGQNLNTTRIRIHTRYKANGVFEEYQSALTMAQNANIDLAQLQREIICSKRPSKKLQAAVEVATDAMLAKLNEVERLREQVKLADSVAVMAAS